MVDENLALALYEIGAVKFGEFKLKSGMMSPIYMDLRVLVSYPSQLRQVAHGIAEILSTLAFDRIAAIPYAALPIGTAVALVMNRPMIYPRKERKEHGTGRMIEGEFHAGERAVVIDDVITTGASKIEAIEPLVAAGLAIRDIVVLIDRSQGGASELIERGLVVHSVIGMDEILEQLRRAGKVDGVEYNKVMGFLRGKRDG